MEEADLELAQPESAGKASTLSRKQAIIGWAMVGLIVLVAAALWAFR